MKDAQKDFLKKITGMAVIPFVTAGIASESDGFVISEDGITKLVESAMSAEGSAAKVIELTTAATASSTKVVELTSQVETLTAANTKLEGEKVALQTEVTRLGTLDGGKFSKPDGKKEKTSEETIEYSQSQKDLLEKANS
jgi:hypothetical protein